MRELTEKAVKESGDPVIVFNDTKQYMKLVHEQVARDYDVVLMLTLPPADQLERCLHCIEAEKNFMLSSNSIVPHAPEDRPIFFVILYFDSEDQMRGYLFLEEYKLQAVPTVAFSPAQPRGKKQNLFRYKWEMQVREKHSPAIVVDYVNRVLKTDYRVRYTLE